MSYPYPDNVHPDDIDRQYVDGAKLEAELKQRFTEEWENGAGLVGIDAWQLTLQTYIDLETRLFFQNQNAEWPKHAVWLKSKE